MQSVLIRSAKPHHRYNVAARSTRAIKSPDHAMCLFEPLLPHLPAAPPLTHPVGECSPTDPQTRRGPCTGTVSVRWCRRWLHTAHIGYARPVTGPRSGCPRHGHCFLINLSLSLSLSLPSSSMGLTVTSLRDVRVRARATRLRVSEPG